MKLSSFAAALALWLGAVSVQGQVSDDELLGMGGGKAVAPGPKSTSSSDKGSEPATTAAQKGSAPADPSPADARRTRREARKVRRAKVDESTEQARSSDVSPADAQDVASPASEKSAARASSVETIADDPRKTAAVTGARRGRGDAAQRSVGVSRPRPVRKKSAYDVARESWHAPAPAEMCAQFRATAVPDLVLRIQGKDLTYVLKPQSRQGGWDETQLATAKEAFGSWSGGPTPHPRTLNLVYAATLHFGCPYVTLISGVRKDRGGSRHSHGLAADIVLPGVDDEELAAFFRAQGFVGVGTYPRAGFVHVDTRDQSFFWIDRSKPNQHGKVIQVRRDESRAADEAARARGDDGASFVNPPRLQRALRVRAVKKMRAHRAKLAREAAKASP